MQPVSSTTPQPSQPFGFAQDKLLNHLNCYNEIPEGARNDEYTNLQVRVKG
jgi:hypothetical protein